MLRDICDTLLVERRNNTLLSPCESHEHKHNTVCYGLARGKNKPRWGIKQGQHSSHIFKYLTDAARMRVMGASGSVGSQNTVGKKARRVLGCQDISFGVAEQSCCRGQVPFTQTRVGKDDMVFG